MSTRRIRELIEYVKRHPVGDLLGNAAMEEVEAIERAAKVLVAWNRDGQRRLDPDAARAWRVIAFLAKETT